LQVLRSLCVSPSSERERLYLGRSVSSALINTQPRYRWNNAPYLEHTGGAEYLPFMLGGGHVLSRDLVAALLLLRRRVGLVFTLIEDATVGLWLAGMHVRWLDWRAAFATDASACCFERTG